MLVSIRLNFWYVEYNDIIFRSFPLTISGDANFRRFASSSDGKKKFKNYGMVNNVRTEKLKKERPSLTIYPFSIDELKEPTQFHEAIDKNAKRTHVQESLEKNTQNKMIEQTPTKTQQEIEQIVNQMDMFELLCFCSFLQVQ